MEIPKVLWLKKRMKPELFQRCQFFDLPDFLTYHATEDNTRSYCSITCKCSYVPSEDGWQAAFFEKIGLPEFVKESYRQIGAVHRDQVLGAGMPIGKGLTKKAAEELGLVEGTPVGSGVIDACVVDVVDSSCLRLTAAQVCGVARYCGSAFIGQWQG
jgi:ribulose kinase